MPVYDLVKVNVLKEFLHLVELKAPSMDENIVIADICEDLAQGTPTGLKDSGPVQYREDRLIRERTENGE